MQEEEEFVDYYRTLQVRPDCDPRTLEVVYHHLAKIYHPDHNQASDVTQFQRVIKAYRVLKNADRRAQYDEVYFRRSNSQSRPAAPGQEFGANSNAAVNDGEAHEKILLLLYKNRREDANNAGVVEWLLQEMLDCPGDLFKFHVWYLKSKGFIELTEKGTLAITIEGVDHVIEHSRAEVEKELYLTRARDGDVARPANGAD